MTAFNILETNIIHASDVIYWLDGSTAESTEKMERLRRPVTVQPTARPSDLKMLAGNGKTALWRRSGGFVLAGPADDEDKAFAPAAPYTLAGVVSDVQGRYNPRRFNITAGTAGGHSIVMYPSPLGVRFTKAGGLKGTLRWNETETAVPWALLTLQVEIAMDEFLLFRSQADARGDFLMPLKRLPPLPEGIDYYAARLFVAAPASDATSEPVDPSDLTAAFLGSLESEDTLEAEIALQIVFGEIRLLQTINKEYLSVQPS